MIKVDYSLTPESLEKPIKRMFELSGEKILSIAESWDISLGAPVFTVNGRYTTRGWTEWTQGFEYGSALIQYEVSGDDEFLKIGRDNIFKYMAPHLTHFGVHDHGFNNISTYGNLLRLMNEGMIPFNENEKAYYELALKVSGAVQAVRWTTISNGLGYIYSFNGPHSLFIDTMRSLRSLAVAHRLGHSLRVERDKEISLLTRLLQHGLTTATYSVYYGTGRDIYDVRGRVAHESIFDVIDGSYRCPNSQQGYSPFTTWTRGLAWAILGFAEEIEFLESLKPEEKQNPDTAVSDLGMVCSKFLEAAQATADYYIQIACSDGVPYWDSGAPNLYKLGDYSNMPSNPFNEWEPVDSSAAAIAAQGLLRLSNCLLHSDKKEDARKYRQAGLTILRTLLDEPYLSVEKRHQGLLLHSVYHRPFGWDYAPCAQKVPYGESSMWGDYHLREISLYVWRMINKKPCLTFFAGM
ncbi:MAG: glycosyl hydrolase [Verrucomicrobiia bacterium]|jgi:hypothetical protein